MSDYVERELERVWEFGGELWGPGKTEIPSTLARIVDSVAAAEGKGNPLPPPQSELPEGFPHRAELEAAGLVSLAMLEGMEGDFPRIRGVGPAGAKLIAEALAAHRDASA